MVIKAGAIDITELGELADCIVNAANETLLGGGGVDGAIHAAAGPRLLEECRALNGCKPGEAKATKAYNLPQKYIIHTVGPKYGQTKNPAKVLRECYENCLRLADALGCEIIAFPSIATGSFDYPVEEAADICAKTVMGFTGKHLKAAYLCAMPGDMKTVHAYDNAFGKYYFLVKTLEAITGNTLTTIVDETRSFDFAVRPFYLMYLNRMINREKLINRLSYFGLESGLEDLSDREIAEIIESMDANIEKGLMAHLIERSIPIETLWEFWNSKLAYPDGCYSPTAMPKDIDVFYFGKPPFYIRMSGGLLFDPTFITKDAYDPQKYKDFLATKK